MTSAEPNGMPRSGDGSLRAETGRVGTTSAKVVYRWLKAPSDIDAALSDQLATCWWEVSNAGGAVGFPFLPVGKDDVEVAVGRLIGSLDPEVRILLVAVSDEVLRGWLLLERNSNPLTAHWARVVRLQTALGARGSGIGHALMSEAARAARDDLGLVHLHIEVRRRSGARGLLRVMRLARDRTLARGSPVGSGG